MLRLSQSRLDTYGDCHLKYFLQYMLSLEDDEPFTFNPADTGTYVHSILERFVRDTQAAGRRIADYTPEELHVISVRLCTEESRRIMCASGGGNARFISFFSVSNWLYLSLGILYFQLAGIMGRSSYRHLAYFSS